MQCGPIVGTLEYAPEGGPLWTLFLMIPFSFLCLFIVILTTRITIPSLLLKGKGGRFALAEFAMAYITSAIELILTYYIWVKWDYIPEGSAINWFGLSINALCNSVVLFLTLLALGGWNLFLYWKNDLERETSLTGEIDRYISEVRNMIQPSRLLSSIKEIAELVKVNARKAETLLTDLSENLRKELYHLPAPPVNTEMSEEPTIGEEGINKFIADKRYKWLRAVCFQVLLIIIACGAFFYMPDQADFKSRFEGAVTMLIMFEAIAGINILIIFRRFKKKRSIKSFIISSASLAAVVILPILVARINLYLNAAENPPLFILTTSLATAASLLMFIFYLAGISAYLLYKDWLRETRKLVILNASVKRLEYSWLKKQINPHFLFNVLNNAHILADVEPKEARLMLLQLSSLLDYQFKETEKEYSSLNQTVCFIKAYLSLEATRIENFTFKINVQGDTSSVIVPSLIFIPFVENAVKYSGHIHSRPDVAVTFRVSGTNLEFTCTNPVNDKTIRPGKDSGGLGIANTIRRLYLIYEDKYRYEAVNDNGIYKTFISIPITQ